MKTPFTIVEGTKTWISKPGDTFTVTGVDRSNKRFKITSTSYGYIKGVNVWRGSKWLNRDGKRFLIQRVFN